MFHPISELFHRLISDLQEKKPTTTTTNSIFFNQFNRQILKIFPNTCFSTTEYLKYRTINKQKRPNTCPYLWHVPDLFDSANWIKVRQRHKHLLQLAPSLSISAQIAYYCNQFAHGLPLAASIQKWTWRLFASTPLANQPGTFGKNCGILGEPRPFKGCLLIPEALSRRLKTVRPTTCWSFGMFARPNEGFESTRHPMRTRFEALSRNSKRRGGADVLLFTISLTP